MSNETKYMSIDVVDEMIQKLLAKTDFDENLEIELYGYPVDFLNDPTDIGEKNINERYNALVDGNEYFKFVFCYTNQSGFQLGDILTTEEPQYLLDFGSKKAWVNTKELKSLIYDNKRLGYAKRTRSGYEFLIKVPTQLLLDSAISNK